MLMTGKIEAADWGAAKPRPGGRETAGPLAWIRRRFDPFLRFRRDEDGGPSVEFVLVFPMFMILVASACETGILLTRQMMLQHGTELAARAIRLGTAEQVSHSDIRTMVFDGAGIVPDCQNQLKVEMIRLDPDNWQAPPAHPDCVDRNEPGIPNRSFQHGAEH